MCGRFTLTVPVSQLAQLFDLAEVIAMEARYNIAPTQMVPVLRWRPDGTGRELIPLRWGLVPFWAADLAIGNRLINARAETVAEKPAFRAAFRQRRCLVPADGFFEWRKSAGKKQPFYFRQADGRPFALAGLWEHWDKSGQGPVETFTILTTTANSLLAPFHDRMPVIVAPKDYERWLDCQPQPPGIMEELLKPLAPEALIARPVNTRVNNPRNEGPECIGPPEKMGSA